ncbi:hypothetical protein SARC_03185 [Sphaeroforma arctica JP610]|uniref:U6 small nuclear RNA (adenine-(43)-N(6))-methyltransferase n=1 Tax=Sphaeroforma arctica JP610 TaxID=667725 RepID=A0A0L0G8R5_9EUKA|nr:hypothetical protein SARC_03185 [Sphaeroforma arctica JP610]KNC84618.1 hypothetical protein SARC_03185 [Sphaeroforma arctica JP610]|eukprot:XP_014158520.1 hypothetical protein SARC_03185 [Sphaeroforma arctica JP610]
MLSSSIQQLNMTFTNRDKYARGGAPLNQHMHPRNQFRYTPPDFEALATQWPALKAHLVPVNRGCVGKSDRNDNTLSQSQISSEMWNQLNGVEEDRTDNTLLQVNNEEKSQGEAVDVHDTQDRMEATGSAACGNVQEAAAHSGEFYMDELVGQPSSVHRFTLDFKDDVAVRELLYALLHVHYGLKLSMPLDRLVPTVTSRENYIHWVADLIEHAQYSHSIHTCDSIVDRPLNLCEREASAINRNAQTHNDFTLNKIQTASHNSLQDGKQAESNLYRKRKHRDGIGNCVETTDSSSGTVSESTAATGSNSDAKQLRQFVLGFDVGVGASCIYPLLGNTLYGWHFEGSDINAASLQYACDNVSRNNLNDFIKLVHVGDAERVLCGVLDSRYVYGFVMCNPPFFADAHEAQTGGVAKQRLPHAVCTGAENEMQTDGGELGFVSKMIEDSMRVGGRVRWYTSMVGKKSSLNPLLSKLKSLGVQRIKHTVFNQGRTVRWGIAWSLVPDVGQGGSVFAGEHPRACMSRCPCACVCRYTTVPSQPQAGSASNVLTESHKQTRHEVRPMARQEGYTTEEGRLGPYTQNLAQGLKRTPESPAPLHRTTSVTPCARVYTIALHCEKPSPYIRTSEQSKGEGSKVERMYRTLVYECVMETLLDFEVSVQVQTHEELQDKIEWCAYRNTWSRKYRRDKSRRLQAAVVSTQGLVTQDRRMDSTPSLRIGQAEPHKSSADLTGAKKSHRGGEYGTADNALDPIFKVATTILPICDCVLQLTRAEYGDRLARDTRESLCRCAPDQQRDVRVACAMQGGDELMWKALLVHFQRGLLLRHERKCIAEIAQA